jgi:DNA-binding NarL/FixJ family response regulator
VYEKPTAVLLLDGHWITRTAVRMAMAGAGDLEIMAEAENIDSALAHMSGGALPDILLTTDAHDPAVVITRLTEALPQWPIRMLMIGGDGFPDAFDHRCAAAGWLAKSSTEMQFLAAIRLVAAGHFVVPRLPDSVPAVVKPLYTNGSALTARERDVLCLLAEGYTNAEISTNLRLGESTVKSHVQNLLAKLGARNRVKAAIYAYEVGLVRVSTSAVAG